MKKCSFKIQPAVVLFLVIFIGCSNNPDEESSISPTVKLLKSSACKNLKSAGPTELTSDSLSCVNYLYDPASQKLSINHINTGFNCCPDTLSCKVHMSGDTIVISEFEKKAGCKCNCLYDLQMEVDAIPSGKYQIRMIEPYCGSQKPLIFGIDLKKDPVGSYCVVRKQYPWGI
jgi:hypothetical protein